GAVLALGALIVRDAAPDLLGRARLILREGDDEHVGATGAANHDGLAARIEAEGEVVTAGPRAEAHLATAASIGDEVGDVDAPDDHLERRVAVEFVDLEHELSVARRLEREGGPPARVGIDPRRREWLPHLLAMPRVGCRLCGNDED